MKKILLIIYYWPPSGGSGVQRWVKFVKYLPQFEWMPTVITTKDGDYPVLDRSLLKEIPPNIKIIRTKTPIFKNLFRKLIGKQSSIPYGSLEIQKEDSIFKKFLINFRINFIIPDIRKIWNRHAYKAAKRELKLGNYDAVITSGPPHSTHLIGYKLKQKFNIKWISDFRDPWTEIDYLKKVKRCRLTEKLDKKLESKVIMKSDIVLGINRKILTELNSIDKGFIIPNGFDSADFAGIQKKKTDKFEINYFGSIASERNPVIILKAVNKIITDQTEIQMNFWGNIITDVKAELHKLDTNKIIKFHDYITHVEMLQKMVNSSLLLLIINNVPDNKGILTGKIYEYLNSEIPILAIGPENGEAAVILNKTNSGKMFDYEKIDEMQNFIEEIYHNKIHFSFTGVEVYERKNLTKKLVKVLGQ